MFVKDKCFDIFQHAKIGKLRIYEETSLKKILNFKYFKNNKLSQYCKLKMMTCLCELSSIDPILFIQIKKKQIELAKEIYILDIE